MSGFEFKVDLARLLVLKGNPAELVREVSRQGSYHACLPEKGCLLGRDEFGKANNFILLFHRLGQEILEKYSALSKDDQIAINHLVFGDLSSFISDSRFVREDGPLRFVAAFITGRMGSNKDLDRAMLDGITNYNKLFFCAFNDVRGEVFRERKDIINVLENLSYWFKVFQFSTMKSNKFPSDYDYFLSALSPLADILNNLFSFHVAILNDQNSLIPLVLLLTDDLDYAIDWAHSQLAVALNVTGAGGVGFSSSSNHVAHLERLRKLGCVSARFSDLCKKLSSLEAAESRHYSTEEDITMRSSLEAMMTKLAVHAKSVSMLEENYCSSHVSDDKNLCEVMKDIKEKNRHLLNTTPESSSSIGKRERAMVQKSLDLTGDNRHIAAEHGRLIPFSNGVNGRLSDVSLVSEVSPSLLAGIGSLSVVATVMGLAALGYAFFKKPREEKRIGNVYYVKTSNVETSLDEVVSHSCPNLSSGR